MNDFEKAVIDLANSFCWQQYLVLGLGAVAGVVLTVLKKTKVIK